MANRTIILQGITVDKLPVGKGFDHPIDLTPKYITTFGTIETRPTTHRFFSTIVSEVIEGKGRYFLARKKHINRYNSTIGIYKEDNSVGGNVLADTPSRAGFIQSQGEVYEFILDKSWDFGFIYDKRKDPKVVSKKLLNDMYSAIQDKHEQEAHDFYNRINEDIAITDGATSKTYPKYVGSRKTDAINSPKLNKVLEVETADSLDNMKLNATNITNAIWNMVEDIAKMGRVGSEHESFPFARGTREILNIQVVIKADVEPVLSLDPRFIPIGKGNRIIEKGIIGTINNVNVVRDDVMDTVSKHDVIVLATGQYSPIMLVDELVPAFRLFDDPFNATLTTLLRGDGAFDTHLNPLINLTRTLVIKTKSAPARTPKPPKASTPPKASNSPKPTILPK